MVPHTIVDRKFEKSKFSIIVYCLEDNISVNEELDFSNFLSIKHDLNRLKYMPFEVTEIVSIKKYMHVCIFLLLENSKKMEIIPASKRIEYFNNLADQNKTEKLHSICITRSNRFLLENIRAHNNSYWCFCVKCRICRLLVFVRFSRKHQKILKIILKIHWLYIQ